MRATACLHSAHAFGHDAGTCVCIIVRVRVRASFCASERAFTRGRADGYITVRGTYALLRVIQYARVFFPIQLKFHSLVTAPALTFGCTRTFVSIRRRMQQKKTSP